MLIDVSIVIPTYNEQDNISNLIDCIYQTLSKEKFSFEIIIVDDDSSDETQKKVLSSKHNYCVKLISRKGKIRGLGLSVLEGFLKSDAKVCVVMDADFSHPVSTLPALINPILNNDADICVGSRFVQGGGIIGWPWYRHLISRVAAFLGYGLTSMTDITSGFMAINRIKINFSIINPYSWKIVLEIVVKSYNLRIKDIPIIFKDREFGKSKISLNEYKAYIIHLYHLYVYKFNYVPLFSKFVCVGFVGLIIDMSIFFLLFDFFSWDIRLSSIISFIFAALNNYILNKYWTFPKNKKTTFMEFMVFIAISCMGLLLRTSFIQLCLLFFSTISLSMAMIVNLFAIFLATFSNFLGSKLLFLRK